MLQKQFLYGLALTAFTGGVSLAFWIAPGNSGNEIIYSEDGFTPAMLAIEPGEAVTFINASGRNFWPASDLHPTHSLYSEFDPKQPIPPDESWTFIPEKTGRWTYHDHLSPIFIGEITVNGDGIAYPVETSNCEKITKETDLKKCWRENMRAAARGQGVREALEILGGLYEREPLFAAECHSYAHIIGEEAYGHFAKEESFDISEKAAYCGYGFFHGFMEALLARTGNFADARKFCDYMDNQLLGRIKNAGLACLHGIGHGTVDGSDKSRWGDAQALVEPGLDICDKITTTDNERYRCYSGAFNSISIAYISSLYGLKIDPENPLAFCEAQKEQYAMACYTDMMVALFSLAKKDLGRAIPFIERIPEQKNAIPAMETLSSLVARDKVGVTEYRDVIDACRKADADLELNCLLGFGNGLMEFGPPKKEYENALIYCTSDLLERKEAEACVNKIMNYADSVYDADTIGTVCQRIATYGFSNSKCGQ